MDLLHQLLFGSWKVSEHHFNCHATFTLICILGEEIQADGERVIITVEEDEDGGLGFTTTLR